MSCITPCQLQPGIRVSKIYQLSRLPNELGFVQIHPINLGGASLKLTAHVLKSSQHSPILKYKQSKHVCLFCGEGKSENATEDPPFESLEKDMGTSKKSIEDVLREQIEKLEYVVEPYLGRGGKPPRGGGGGSGGDKSGGSEDNNDETWQFIFATASFALLYFSTIFGEDMILLGRDYIRYLCTGNRTFRLRKTTARWEQGKTMGWWEMIRPTSSKRTAEKRIEDDDNDEDEDEDDT